eukprot:TRINITY_DN1068_c0_g3_i5.p1 TRINITY_DN1068_c0_g3~~TRINITY_DN1068_c0_g3_i5.p1  ORF type:complete len:146 (-),score=21.60 TRINITY_DN1068_c0_g3_i5:22-459(-)
MKKRKAKGGKSKQKIFPESTEKLSEVRPRKISEPVTRQYKERVARTVLLLNCRDEYTEKGSSISLKLTLDVFDEGRPRKFWARKYALGSCMEGISHYCRLGYDLRPTSLISVFTVTSTVNRLNNWHPEQQQVSEVKLIFCATLPL